MQKNNIFGTDTPASKIGDVNAYNNIDALGPLGLHDIIIVYSKHVESIILLQKKNS